MKMSKKMMLMCLAVIGSYSVTDVSAFTRAEYEQQVKTAATAGAEVQTQTPEVVTPATPEAAIADQIKVFRNSSSVKLDLMSTTYELYRTKFLVYPYILNVFNDIKAGLEGTSSYTSPRTPAFSTTKRKTGTWVGYRYLNEKKTIKETWTILKASFDALQKISLTSNEKKAAGKTFYIAYTRFAAGGAKYMGDAFGENEAEGQQKINAAKAWQLAYPS